MPIPLPRHASEKNVSIEQWLAWDTLSPCSAKEAQCQLQQPRKLGWISERLGENENTKDLHISRQFKMSYHVKEYNTSLILLRENIPYIPGRYLDNDMNCHYCMCEWTWHQVSEFCFLVISALFGYYLVSWIKYSKHETAMKRTELLFHPHFCGREEVSLKFANLGHTWDQPEVGLEAAACHRLWWMPDPNHTVPVS